MPKTRKIRRAAAGLALAAGLLGAAVWALRAALPDTFYVAEGNQLSFGAMPFLTAEETSSPSGDPAAPAAGTLADRSQSCTVKLLGVLPVKTVRTVAAERRTVAVSGAPFGIKMFSDGALVVAFSDQLTALGSENPAKEAGLRLGDLIVSANGKNIRTNEELSAAIAAAGGQPLRIVYLRDGAEHTCTLIPVADAGTGTYRAGVWVRDSSAGIGTLTFTDPLHGTFAGLGHAISDSDTGTSIQLLSGEIVPVTITGCVKGAAGSPGELRGEFSGGEPLGAVRANDSTGVYGILTNDAPLAAETFPVAMMQEVELGEAEILTTINGTTPARYTVTIEKINMTAGDPNRNLLVRLTDEALLAATGGIVQGMSGSPILQNGRLVGAVTHVLVNDPTRGYGIFAETMLSKADGIA